MRSLPLSSWLGRVAAILAAAALLYLVSPIPVALFLIHSHRPYTSAGRFYAPVLWLRAHTPLRGAIDWADGWLQRL